MISATTKFVHSDVDDGAGTDGEESNILKTHVELNSLSALHVFLIFNIHKEKF